METITVSNSSRNSVSSNVEEVSSTSPMKPPPLLPPPPLQERLQRLISGASVVLDPPEPGNETESRKLPSSKYKGVVPQPNGRWGAQIYEKHQRVWLGTFNEEVEAARVYDIAAQRFRGRDAVTNFKSLSETNESDALVLFFLNSHSKAEIVDMLRKHTYHDEIHRSRMTSAGNLLKLKNGAILRYQGISGLSARDHLFDKVVTPSDVGKLNRLVVPKQHAEKYFPLNVGKSSTSNGVLLNFEDSSRKVWRFRYSYWNSSQSYVLTKGWSRFVKEKGLSAGDIVSFHRSNGPDRSLHIDWKRRSTISVGGGSGCDSYRSSNIRIQPVRPVEVVRLFGVNIVKSPEPLTVEDGNRFTSNEDWSGKRRRDQLEILRSHCFTKKQHIGMLGWERR